MATKEVSGKQKSVETTEVPPVKLLAPPIKDQIKKAFETSNEREVQLDLSPSGGVYNVRSGFGDRPEYPSADEILPMWGTIEDDPESTSGGVRLAVEEGAIWGDRALDKVGVVGSVSNAAKTLVNAGVNPDKRVEIDNVYVVGGSNITSVMFKKLYRLSHRRGVTLRDLMDLDTLEEKLAETEVKDTVIYKGIGDLPKLGEGWGHKIRSRAGDIDRDVDRGGREYKAPGTIFPIDRQGMIFSVGSSSSTELSSYNNSGHEAGEIKVRVDSKCSDPGNVEMDMVAWRWGVVDRREGEITDRRITRECAMDCYITGARNLRDIHGLNPDKKVSVIVDGRLRDQKAELGTLGELAELELSTEREKKVAAH